MNKKTKVIIIGGGRCLGLSTLLKNLPEEHGFAVAQSFEIAAQQFQKISELHSKSIKDFSLAVNNLKVSLKTLENSQPKSKYINKPQHNFKNRGIPQKRNNQKYYKKR